jgi:4-diphosphocytidyl-2-C-methyl-D-erythritol kinase
LRDLSSVPVEEWKEHFFNDFETVVFQKFPEIKEIKKRLYAAGAVYTSMTGSGSAVYGLFRMEQTPDCTFPDSLVWRSELT